MTVQERRMSFTWFVGSRYIRSKQKEGFISLITFLATVGIALGVMVLIVVIAVMTSFETELQNRILGMESHVLVMRYGESVSDIDETVETLETLHGIESASPFIYTQVMLRSSNGLSGSVLKAIDPSRPCPPVTVDGKIALCDELGSTPDDTSSDLAPGIIIGRITAEKLDVRVKDPIFLISPLGKGAAANRLPTVMRFTVSGIFETGMNEYDGAMSFVRLDVAQKLLEMPGQATGFEVRVKDIYQAATIAESIVHRLGFPYWARDWMQMNRNLFSMLRLQKSVSLPYFCSHCFGCHF